MEQLKKIIEEQRAGKENSPVWMVGEQLLDIASESPLNCELIKKDLQVVEMDLDHAERQLKEWADKQKKVNGCVCVSPKVADEILRKFYGIEQRGEHASKAVAPTAAPASEIDLDLSSFL